MRDDDLYYVPGELPETEAPSATPAPWRETTIVGKPLPRVDAYERVSGSAVFPSDVILPDMLYGATLRCPHAHAHVKSVDTSAAERLPGVRAILTNKDPEANIGWFDGPKGPMSRLFDPHCRYEGEEVAAVAAETPYQAWDAVRAIRVEYEVLPFAVTQEAAGRDGAPQIHDFGNKPPAQKPYVRGDIAKGFAEAEMVVEQKFTTATELHAPMELYGATVRWDGRRLTVWESTQGVYSIQQALARALKLPLSNVRVIGHYMGGGFGSKLAASKQTVIAALMARRTARPVRMFVTREEAMRAMGNRPPATMTIKIGAKKDGTLTALRMTIASTGGAYVAMGSNGIGFQATELYACPNVTMEAADAFVNAGPSRPFRGPGHPQGNWALEQAMDMLADRLKMDPVDLRLKNVSLVSQSRESQPPYTSTGLRDCLVEGAKAFGWKEARAKARSTGPLKRGVGMAAGMWRGGGGGDPSTIVVKLFPDGSVNLNMGASDNGCGTKTVMAQVVAEELGVAVDRIDVEYADTATTQFATGSGGSKTVPTESPAVRAAAIEVKQQLIPLAAEALKVDPPDIELREGFAVSKADATKKVSLGAIPALQRRTVLVGVGYRGPNPAGKAINPFAVQFAEVEVNTRTGEVQVLRFLAAHDSGRILNTLTCRNQVFGGIAMGTGFALTEGRVMDEVHQGRVLTANLHDYKLPTAMDVAVQHDVIFLDPHDVECNTTGTKGIGEPATIPTASAIANAIAHATGVRVTDTPVDPGRLVTRLTPAAKRG